MAASGFTYVDGGAQPGVEKAGTVTSSSPSAGSLLSSGSSVTVYTSDGSQITVPSVTGKPLNDARAQLNEVGLTNVAIADQYAKGGGDKECRVAAVDPGVHTNASKDSTVTLTLYGDKNGKAPKDCK
ncbi:PASTA domain-containing protein [Curtobacterium flaccumfaciens]|nr:PASTA domain-containing protein [Curtobacterium flaccumfaciens]